MPCGRVREWGTCAKVLDMIDEKMLSPPEMRNLMGLIFGKDVLKASPLTPAIPSPSP